MGDGYRCGACRDTKSRCRDCRLRRAKADSARRELKRAAGTCVACAADAELGFARCKAHMVDNAQRSGAAHAAARQQRSD